MPIPFPATGTPTGKEEYGPEAVLPTVGNLFHEAVAAQRGEQSVRGRAGHAEVLAHVRHPDGVPAPQIDQRAQRVRDRARAVDIVIH